MSKYRRCQVHQQEYKRLQYTASLNKCKIKGCKKGSTTPSGWCVDHQKDVYMTKYKQRLSFQNPVCNLRGCKEPVKYYFHICDKCKAIRNQSKDTRAPTCKLCRKTFEKNGRECCLQCSFAYQQRHCILRDRFRKITIYGIVRHFIHFIVSKQPVIVEKIEQEKGSKQSQVADADQLLTTDKENQENDQKHKSLGAQQQFKQNVRQMKERIVSFRTEKQKLCDQDLFDRITDFMSNMTPENLFGVLSYTNFLKGNQLSTMPYSELHFGMSISMDELAESMISQSDLCVAQTAQFDPVNFVLQRDFFINIIILAPFLKHCGYNVNGLLSSTFNKNRQLIISASDHFRSNNMLESPSWMFCRQNLLDIKFDDLANSLTSFMNGSPIQEDDYQELAFACYLAVAADEQRIKMAAYDTYNPVTPHRLWSLLFWKLWENLECEGGLNHTKKERKGLGPHLVDSRHNIPLAAAEFLFANTKKNCANLNSLQFDPKLFRQTNEDILDLSLSSTGHFVRRKFPLVQFTQLHSLLCGYCQNNFLPRLPEILLILNNGQFCDESREFDLAEIHDMKLIHPFHKLWFPKKATQAGIIQNVFQNYGEQFIQRLRNVLLFMSDKKTIRYPIALEARMRQMVSLKYNESCKKLLQTQEEPQKQEHKNKGMIFSLMSPYSFACAEKYFKETRKNKTVLYSFVRLDDMLPKLIYPPYINALRYKPKESSPQRVFGDNTEQIRTFVRSKIENKDVNDMAGNLMGLFYNQHDWFKDFVSEQSCEWADVERLGVQNMLEYNDIEHIRHHYIRCVVQQYQIGFQSSQVERLASSFLRISEAICKGQSINTVDKYTSPTAKYVYEEQMKGALDAFYTVAKIKGSVHHRQFNNAFSAFRQEVQIVQDMVQQVNRQFGQQNVNLAANEEPEKDLDMTGIRTEIKTTNLLSTGEPIWFKPIDELSESSSKDIPYLVLQEMQDIVEENEQLQSESIMEEEKNEQKSQVIKNDQPSAQKEELTEQTSQKDASGQRYSLTQDFIAAFRDLFIKLRDKVITSNCGLIWQRGRVGGGISIEDTAVLVLKKTLQTYRGIFNKSSFQYIVSASINNNSSIDFVTYIIPTMVQNVFSSLNYEIALSCQGWWERRKMLANPINSQLTDFDKLTLGQNYENQDTQVRLSIGWVMEQAQRPMSQFNTKTWTLDFYSSNLNNIMVQFRNSYEEQKTAIASDDDYDHIDNAYLEELADALKDDEDDQYVYSDIEVSCQKEQRQQ